MKKECGNCAEWTPPRDMWSSRNPKAQGGCRVTRQCGAKIGLMMTSSTDSCPDHIPLSEAEFFNPLGFETWYGWVVNGLNRDQLVARIVKQL